MVDDALGFLSVVELLSFHDSFSQSCEFLVGKCADLPLDVTVLGDEEECRDGLDACSTITKTLLQFMPDRMV